MNRTWSCLKILGRSFTIRYNAVTPATPMLIRPMCVRSPSSPAFIFLDNENINAHNVMVNDPMYFDTVINPYNQNDWPSVSDKQFHTLITQEFHRKTTNEIYDDFYNISAYIIGKDFNIVDTMFDGLRNQLIANASQFSDEQLMSILKLISLWNIKNLKDPNFYSFWSTFDKQCVVRYKNWSLNKILLFMDHWYVMKLSRLSNFVWLGLRKLARKPSRLTPKQLVQMMFYANTSRKFLPTLPMYDIEQELCSYYNDFSIKELGIIALGFFKSQTPIRNQELVKNLYISVINNITNINSLELAAFLKIFRYCTKHINADSMYKLMNILLDKVDEVQLVCCTHMALLGTNLLIKHEELLKKISQRIVNEISQARVKDIERITLALTMFNYNPQLKPCIFETIVKELRNDARKLDFEQHTKCYLFTLSYLALNNIFPYDCISKALNLETLNSCYGKKLTRFNIPRDILCLNNSMLIECPDYSGPLLADELKKSCNEHLSWHIPTSSTFKKESIGDKYFKTFYRELIQLFKNESYLHVCYLLPHHPKCDILFCISPDGKPVTIPEAMKKTTIFNDFQQPPQIGKWFAIVILVRNSVIYYSNEYNGLTSCKLRQLKKLGYEPIVITLKELESISDYQNVILDKLKFHNVILKEKKSPIFV